MSEGKEPIQGVLNVTVATIGCWYYPQYLTKDGWFFFYDEEGNKVCFPRLDPALLYPAELEREGKLIREKQPDKPYRAWFEA